jgi:redox-sensitive bicupin YhaK (pirin superfamily)
MFPLLQRDAENPLELFQIWLNLPAADKLVPPHFAMLWGNDIPHLHFTDGQGRAAEVTVIAGELDGRRAPAPPPHSWASRPDAHVAIFHLHLDAGAQWTLPAAAHASAARSLYFFDGRALRVAGETVASKTGLDLDPEAAVMLQAIDGPAEALLLQGRPIAEPVVQYGPFVMNTQAEIQRAFQDYQRTRFGDWTWPSEDPTHGLEASRFAQYADGRVERPGPPPP